MFSFSSGIPRSSGVLMHPSSLPGSPVCGTFGAPAREWLHLLAKNGIGVWQFLPLSPCDSTGSPYSSPSAFALNAWFLDAEDLAIEGFIGNNLLSQLPGAYEGNCNFLSLQLAESRSDCLGKYLVSSWPNQSSSRHKEFSEWIDSQDWLNDYAFFIELRRQNNQLPWWEWPDHFAHHDQRALNQWSCLNEKELLEHKLIQWHLDRQWQKIRKLSADLGVLLFGDMPFYVSRDSADVWGKRSLFSVGSSGELEIQSGVPPDYFSETGQLWGTPVYLWESHQATQFHWWRSRFSNQWNKLDFLRLDHFRALVSYWAVSGGSNTAEEGKWEDSPGEELLKYIKQDCNSRLPLVAEDLGIITKGVEILRDKFHLSGMKILQFAFNGEENNPYLPENIKGTDWVVYSGTHDNPTSLEWWNNLDDSIRNIVDKICFNKLDPPAWKLIEIGMSTKANLFIAPIQDLLNLDYQARFNKPGTLGNNWLWKLENWNSSVESSLEKFGNQSLYWKRSFLDKKLLN